MGDPEPAFGFSRILQVLLEERYPDLRFEVINTAFPAINSHVIREIARDCAKCDADVWIVYAGNNEVIGPYGATPAFGSTAPPVQVVQVASFLTRFRIGQCLGDLARKLRARQPAISVVFSPLARHSPNDTALAQRGAAATECSLRDNCAGCRNTAVSRRADWADFVAHGGGDIGINARTASRQQSRTIPQNQLRACPRGRGKTQSRSQMIPAVAHLTAFGLAINDHGSIHATAEEVRPSPVYCNNNLTNPARCPRFPLPLGEGQGEGPRPVNEQSNSKTLDRTNHETVQKV